MGAVVPFPVSEQRPRVDITPGLDGYRVFLFGKLYARFSTLTNAARCAAALTTLDALEALPGQEIQG